MMALYLAEGGSSNRLLGLSCCHILIGPNEANFDYYFYHPSRPSKEVLLSKGAFTNLVNLIKCRIGRYFITVKRWREQIEGFERCTNTVDVEKVMKAWIKIQGMLEKAEGDPGA